MTGAIAATIEAIPCRKIYESANGWKIMQCRANMELPREYAPKTPFFSATGDDLPEKGTFILQGRWKISKKYGYQFEVDTFLRKDPEDYSSIVDLLVSMKIPHVGRIRASRIAKVFMKDTFDILDANAEKLSVCGIKGKQLKEAMDFYEEKRTVRNIYASFHEYNISLSVCSRIAERMGLSAIDYYSNHPYELCRESGVSFSKVDNVRKNKPGFDPNDPERLQMAMLEVLKQAHLEGHMYLNSHTLVARTLAICSDSNEKEVKENGRRMIANEELCHVGAKVMLPNDFKVEKETAEAILRIHQAMIPVKDEEEIYRVIADFSKAKGIQLSKTQQEAVILALSQPFACVTGGAGSGKTTIIQAILYAYDKLFPGQDSLLMAPTGRASKRMEECTGQYACTIHKVLYAMEMYGDKTAPIEAELIIIDEASMIDAYLAHRLFLRIAPGTRVLLVGDCDQLPPVQPGNVFRELLHIAELASIVLTVNFRQKNAKAVRFNADQIRNGKMELLEDESFHFLPEQDVERIAELTASQYVAKVAEKGFDAVQVLSAYKRSTEIGTNALNKRIQGLLHLSTEPHLSFGGISFYVGDRVLQTKNNDELLGVMNGDELFGVMNGEIGTIKGIITGESPQIDVDMDGRQVIYQEADIPQIELAYAVTVHKYQGSECDSVIFPVHPTVSRMLNRNLTYTAVTRAQKEVEILGDKRCFMQSILRSEIGKRNTLLAYFFLKACDKEHVF